MKNISFAFRGRGGGGGRTKQKTPLEENTEYLICCELKPFLNVF